MLRLRLKTNEVSTAEYTLRVDPTGNDSYTRAQVLGDPDTFAWATVCRACWGVAPASWDGTNGNSSEAAQAGDTVMVEPGTYSVNRGTTGGNSYPTLKAINSGSQNNPIIFRARNRAALTSVNVSKLEHTGANGPILNMGGSYVFWDGFYINEDNAYGSQEGIIWLTGDHSGVVFCEILGQSDPNDHTNNYGNNHGLIYSGANASAATNNVIGCNKIHRHYPDSIAESGQNSTAILVYDNNYLTVEYNEIYDCVDGGIQYKGGNSNPKTGMVIRYNKIYGDATNVTSTALMLRNYGLSDAADSTLIYQNLIYDTNYGIYLKDDVDGPVQGVTIVNNTIDQSASAHDQWRPGITIQPSTTGVNYVARNNLMTDFTNSWADAGGRGFAWRSTNSALSSEDVDRNFYANIRDTGSNNGDIGYTNDGGVLSFTSWQSYADANGDYLSSSSAIYTAPGSFDFTLASSSPAKTSQGGPGQDYLQLLGGLQTAGIDCGCYITGVSEVPGIVSNYDYSSYYS